MNAASQVLPLNRIGGQLLKHALPKNAMAQA
jgi:hypothetical protein